jgi:hypothetical protein
MNPDVSSRQAITTVGRADGWPRSDVLHTFFSSSGASSAFAIKVGKQRFYCHKRNALMSRATAPGRATAVAALRVGMGGSTGGIT